MLTTFFSSIPESYQEPRWTLQCNDTMLCAANKEECTKKCWYLGFKLQQSVLVYLV